MKIGIIGCGIVGKSLIDFFEKTQKFTQNYEKIKILKKDPILGYNDNLFDCDFIFISVPVPTVRNECDLSILKEVITELKSQKYINPIIVRSTITPGTTNNLRKEFGLEICHMPEFLTERTSTDDFKNNKKIICGRMYASSENKFKKLFFTKEVEFVENEEAELIKYAHNCFGALKVTFFNGIYKACKLNNLDYNIVRRGILSTGLISMNHTMVPGPDGHTGYGGKCFPKDVRAFIGWLYNQDMLGLMTEVNKLNFIYRDEM